MNKTSKKFGSTFTDHMFVMEWQKDKGWHNKRIQPYGELALDPASAGLHYGQEIFDGQKAFRTINQDVVLFRPRESFKRLNKSAEIMNMPGIDVEQVVTWLKKLVKLDSQWIPNEIGTSLYIRPTMIATEKTLDVKSSSYYLFFIILSPVGAFFEKGFNPVSILVSDKHTRVASGSVGRAKTAGNYGAAMRAQKEAELIGCDQVLWLDPLERNYVQEVGVMNVFFVINNILVTPLLTDSMIEGIIRKSIIDLCSQMNIPFEERHISIGEVIDGIQHGYVQESFGSGTAVVISPIGSLRYMDKIYTINNNQIGSLAQKMFKALTDIQYGITADLNKWLEFVDC